MVTDGSAQRQTQPALSEEYSDMIVRTAPGVDSLSISGISAQLREIFDSSADSRSTAVPAGTEAVQPVNEQYSIIYAPLSDHLSTVEEIGYSSVPKLFTEINVVSLEAAGILSVRIQPFLNLSGKGVLIGFLDSGIDCTHPAFRHADGTTRIVRLWDQGDTAGVPPEGLSYGSEYTEEAINRVLFGGTDTAGAPRSGSSGAPDRDAAPWIPGTDPTGHGTAVAGIACGSADEREGFTGAAPESAIAFVRLKPAKQYLRDYFRIPEDAVAYQENDLMVGVRYLLDCARNLKMPLVICLSLGTSQGGHTGNTPLENVLESASEVPGVCAAAGTGNETGLAHHASGKLPSSGSEGAADIELLVDQETGGFSVEVWTDSSALCALGFTSPLGETFSPILPDIGAAREFPFLLERSRIILTGDVTEAPFLSRVTLIRFLDPTPGIWRIRIASVGSVSDDSSVSGILAHPEITGLSSAANYGLTNAGNFHMWLPISGLAVPGIRFSAPDPDTSLVIPSCAPSVLSVGTYNAYDGRLYPYSGRGYTRNDLVKPDFVSPGVRLTCPAAGGSYSSITGSCAASALAAGAAALLFESGLKQEPPRYFSAEELKELFWHGVQERPGEPRPDRAWGYGIMNLYQIFRYYSVSEKFDT